MRACRLAWLILGMITIVGCSSGKPAASSVEKPTSASNQASSAGTSNEVTSAGTEPIKQPQGPGPSVYQQCGKEINRHGEGYDSAARDCLWQAANDGKPVGFTTTSYTTEGDPITYTIQALGANHGPGPRFTVLVDSKDKFGKQGQFTYTCKSIGRVSYQQGELTESPKRYGFVLSDCAGTGDGTEVHIP